jgi:hypothetical protein
VLPSEDLLQPEAQYTMFHRPKLKWAPLRKILTIEGESQHG